MNQESAEPAVRIIKHLPSWAVISTVTSIGIAAGFLVIPYQSKTEVAEAQAKQAQIDHTQDLRLDQVEGKLENIEKQGARSLQLQLWASKRSLEQDLNRMTPDAPGRRNLEQQLDVINTDLGLRR